MARDEDRQRILADEAADVARIEVAVEPAGQLTVAGGLAVRDLGDELPDLPRPVAAAWVEWQVEIPALAGEVLGQLGGGLVEAVILAGIDLRSERIPVRTGPVARVVHTGQT